ncbi:hypothetical protein MED121_08688 [Marinomonas sp. MED121]|uniref:methyl-accepting chemotaxis protein n=1 Tax=Marinomonas sp. MED121 TaxID=314277 RepID=UPI0000690109|nr:methyl-accepting chemotaxis protein [Marinomonas sp. MED121]EAQ65628.1 hypothetical protein MED121_08688 [Marinomonas sp. MED121]
MTAKAKIIYCIGALFVTMISFISLTSFLGFKQASVAGYTEKLDTQSFLVSSAIEQRMGRIFDVLHVMSNEIDLTAQDENFSEAVQSLRSIIGELDVLNAYVATPDGLTYSTTSKGLVPNFNAKTKNREWFLRAFNGEDNILTKPYVSSEGLAVMAAGVPIIRDGKVIGVICVNLSINKLTNFIAGLTPENQIYVTNADGYVLAAKDTDLLGEDLLSILPSYKVHLQNSNDNHSHSYEYQGQEYFVVASKMALLGWTTWAWDDWSNINAASNQNLSFNLILSAILILISLVIAYYLINKIMYLPIGGEPKLIEKIVNQIAGGNLSNLDKATGKETGVYAAVFVMVENLRSTISKINQTSTELDNASSRILGSASNVMESSESQMKRLEHTSSAMYEMTNTVKEVAQNALEASKATTSANDYSSDGINTVTDMNTSIEVLVEGIEESQKVVTQLESEAAGIGNILNVIRDIAEQTNLLALNAAIEAARAGEQGRGFAVVADEVRSLASRTQESTSQIQEMITRLQGAVSSSVNLMQVSCENAQQTLSKSSQATSALESIRSSVNVINDMNTQIATAADQQTQVASEISANVTGIHDLARKTFDNSRSNTEVASSVSDCVASLNESVEVFKMS